MVSMFYTAPELAVVSRLATRTRNYAHRSGDGCESAVELVVSLLCVCGHISSGLFYIAYGDNIVAVMHQSIRDMIKKNMMLKQTHTMLLYIGIESVRSTQVTRSMLLDNSIVTNLAATCCTSIGPVCIGLRVPIT